MRFHLLTVAHSIPGEEYSTDPFTNKAVTMSRFLFEQGHEVFYYGVEGGELNVKCTEYIPVVKKETFYKTYPTKDSTRKNSFSDANGPAWEEFQKKSPKEIKKRTINNSQEFLLCFFGSHHKNIADEVNLITVEPGIGHGGSFAPYRIFESSSWMHYTYGKENLGWPQNNYNTFIPNFYYADNFEFSSEKEDYFMFMGRVLWGKGLSVAIEIANYFNKKIIIAGYGDLKKEVPKNISLKNIQYVGVLNFKKKIQYLKKAKAFLCPSLYIEPFGHVVPEASFCGTPVLSTNYGAFVETVKNGINGFRNSIFKDYLNGVNNLYKIDPYKCRKFAENNFSVKVISKKYNEYFKNLLMIKNGGWYGGIR